ncbi:MAG: SPOR domain-containing protein [Chlorobiaceae bacterium]|nr:SPOR domain-containing protein [Chlorobiaceae bacterium]
MQKARSSMLSIIAISGSLFCLPLNGNAAQTKISYADEILKDVREDKVYLLENIRRKVTKPSEKMVIEALLTEDGPKAANLYRKQLAEHPDPQLDDVSRTRLAAYERAVAATARPVLNASKQGSPAAQITASQPLPGSTAKKPDTVSRKTPALITPKPATVTAASPKSKKPDSVMQQSPTPEVKPASAVATQKPPTATPSSASTPKTQAPPAARPVSGGAYTLQFGSFDSVTNADQLASQVSSSAQASVQQIGDVYKVRLKRTFATREEATAFARSLPIESFVVTVQP